MKMKKYTTLLCLLIFAIMMVGCGETYSTTGLEFVQAVHTMDTRNNPVTQLVFKGTKGELHIYFATNEDLISLLETGTNYDVTAFQGDNWSTANVVEKITKSK